MYFIRNNNSILFQQLRNRVMVYRGTFSEQHLPDLIVHMHGTYNVNMSWKAKLFLNLHDIFQLQYRAKRE